MMSQQERLTPGGQRYAHEGPSELRCKKEVYDNRTKLTLCASFIAIPMYIHALAQPVGSIWTSLNARYSAM